MKVLFYCDYPDLTQQLQQEINSFSHLKLQAVSFATCPLTLPDYEFLLLAPWQAANEVAAASPKTSLLENFMQRLPTLIELTQARKAQLLVLLPAEKNLTSPAEKQLYQQILACLASYKQHLIIETNPSLNFTPTGRLARLVKQPTEDVQQINYSGVQSLNELARISLAVIAQLAVGAITWGQYSYQTNNPASLIEIIRLLKPVTKESKEAKPVNPLTFDNKHLLETFGIHPRNWQEQLAAHREEINA